jgi:penicillin-binding protein 1C
MQICRMLSGRPRTLTSKLTEATEALRLNAIRSKPQILELYLNMAPYGGNLRGVEAAALYYFGKGADALSLGEAALLAGLPQSPERLRPDRRLQAALVRRNKAFSRMVEMGFATEAQVADARLEPLDILRASPVTPQAPHYALSALARRPRGGQVLLDRALQDEVERVLQARLDRFVEDTEIAAVLIDITNGAVVAMAGSTDFRDPVDGQVNGALARRSPGSALKPFVYAAAIEQGRIAHDTILKDLPLHFAGWAPRNFDRTFSGEVTVEDALNRSLNLPAVYLAREVGLARCLGVMEACGVKLPADASARGGLSLVLGGIETHLLSLTNAYATIGRGGLRMMPRFFADEPIAQSPALQATTCAWLDHMLSSTRFPPQGRSASEISWFMRKTGTSAGKRDAWTVGHNGKYAAGVWVGRFSGMGDESFVGASAAEPLLADLFDLPLVRVDSAPPAPQPLEVTRPLAPPDQADRKLAILFPENGATYQATSSQLVLQPKATRDGPLRWFLNDRLLDDQSLARLAVGKGAHVLQCLPLEGEGASIRFRVR